MQASLFTITAQTNLHVGSGDANYGIIDKLVQRDAVSGLPTIHASSLKGAILQHFDRQSGMTDDYIDEVFGRQVKVRWKDKSRTNADDGKTGGYIFLQAQLLSIPVRSNRQAFFRASGSTVLAELRLQLLDLGLTEADAPLAQALAKLAEESKNKAVVLEQGLAGKHHLEDIKDENLQMTTLTGAGLDKVKSLLGSSAVILPDDKLRALTDNHHLPVIARNFLENGQSTNLWYEQVVPRQSRFSFLVLEKEAPQLSSDFGNRLTGQGLVQVGANATVGYGQCKIEPFKVD